MAETVSSLVFVGNPRRLITISELRDPGVYCRSRPGTHVTDRFRNNVALKAKPVEVGTIFEVNENELADSLSVEEAENLLPKSLLVDESALSAVFAEMRESDQFNEGCTYLFYTTSSVAFVFWDPGNPILIVDSLLRCDAVSWPAGMRILSLVLVK
jgi:hypothetical protein